MPLVVLPSGGDAPGMKAAIRAVVRTALVNDINVIGVMTGQESKGIDFVTLEEVVNNKRKVNREFHHMARVLVR